MLLHVNFPSASMYLYGGVSMTRPWEVSVILLRLG